MKGRRSCLRGGLGHRFQYQLGRLASDRGDDRALDVVDGVAGVVIGWVALGRAAPFEARQQLCGIDVLAELLHRALGRALNPRMHVHGAADACDERGGLVTDATRTQRRADLAPEAAGESDAGGDAAWREADALAAVVVERRIAECAPSLVVDDGTCELAEFDVAHCQRRREATKLAVDLRRRLDRRLGALAQGRELQTKSPSLSPVNIERAAERRRQVDVRVTRQERAEPFGEHRFDRFVTSPRADRLDHEAGLLEGPRIDLVDGHGDRHPWRRRGVADLELPLLEFGA